MITAPIERPIISIVTATRGTFSDYWLSQLQNIQGKVEFILVYPPGETPHQFTDSRIRTLTSTFKGELMQRFLGLINAQGEYVMALDDDDFVHPDIFAMTQNYFDRFPESWVMRLLMEQIPDTEVTRIRSPWAKAPDLTQIATFSQATAKQFKAENPDELGLLEIPIAPLDRPFDWRYLLVPFYPRKDKHGVHFENFNNRVWKTHRVKTALAHFSKSMQVWGALTWMPFWSLDRALGLFIQAEFYKKDAVVGHWLPAPAQMRFIERDPATKEPRTYLAADLLLNRAFPQYGYFWNLFFSQLWDFPRVIAKHLKKMLMKKGAIATVPTTQTWIKTRG
jgi:hypothetical protein